MQSHPSKVRLVSFPLEQPSSSPDTYLYLKDDCEDAGCTETLVLEVVAAIELATSECVGVEDEPSDPLAELIADVIIVGLISSPGSDVTN